MMVAVERRLDVIAALEMMSRDSLSLRMLLSSSSPWVEEVIDTLKSPSSLS